ncbi:MAG TPA: DMT family transporter [Tepidisphaeraceae bacterium]|nr:DMT family transporter [Tepidisphaeraceae bacterium]
MKPEFLDYATPPRPPRATGQRNAALMLALATVFWGCGFTWAKMGGEAVQQAAGAGEHSPFGPVFLLGCRFTLGGVVWILLFPAARRGWTWRGVAQSFAVGTLLALGVIVQHVGLDYTPEAVSAFLTSLTILFVPLLMTVILRKPPRPVLWLGVIVATAGVWLMTGATPRGFGIGELLGLACAFAFSLYILAVNEASKHQTPWRLTAGQFLTTGLLSFATCAVLRDGPHHLSPRVVADIIAMPRVWGNVVLLAVFSTLAAFGLLTHFQPRIDPTRAALIYLIEPVVAAIYAAVAVHHIPGYLLAAGAGLILAANALVEILSARMPPTEAPMVME